MYIFTQSAQFGYEYNVDAYNRTLGIKKVITSLDTVCETYSWLGNVGCHAAC